MAEGPEADLEGLREFALGCLNAAAYPSDYHPFQPYGCSECGVAPLSLVVESYTGCEEGDFHGVITGTCEKCGRTEVKFSVTGERSRPEKAEMPCCECGNSVFWLAMCERYEGEEGLPGFFDEGVMAGQCTACGKNRAIVYTD